jgi:hypothetical protein
MGGDRASTTRMRLRGKICCSCRTPLPPSEFKGERFCDACAAARAPRRRVYMSFMLTKEWYCRFLEEDAQTSLPHTIRMKDPDKIFELAERGRLQPEPGRTAGYPAWNRYRPRKDMAGADRRAVRETQEALKTRWAISLSRHRPIYPFFRRSGSGPDHNVCRPEITLDSRARARVSVILPMFHQL